MSQKLMQTGHLSIQDWKGLAPQKFEKGVKTYNVAVQQSAAPLNPQQPNERRHYSPQTQSQQPNPCVSIRMFVEDMKGQIQLEQQGIKPIPTLSQRKQVPYIYTTRPLLHPQRKHIHIPHTNYIQHTTTPTNNNNNNNINNINNNNNNNNNNKGIKCQYSYPEQSNQYTVDQALGLRRQLDTLEKRRNNINNVSLGDKPYKTPEYQTGFYESEGLATGQTQKIKKKTLSRLKADLKGIKMVGLCANKLWHNKVEQQLQQEDQQAIQALDNWVQHTLIKANPHYKDPDTFFDNLPTQVDKKPTKKK